MSTIKADFFRSKRSWSKIKDKVLSEYMPAYLGKVARLGREILLVDGRAGPGVFDDGSYGSPIIMCEAAERYARDKYVALFVNNSQSHHERLERNLAERGWLDHAIPIQGDSTAFLTTLSLHLRDQTVFVYLDPFGLRGCEFETLKPFLTRPMSYSTEIVLNVSMPVTHRLAATNAVAEGRISNPRITRYHELLSEVFGGDYWKDIYWSDLTAEQKELALIAEYQRRISKYLPYTGSCPVRESRSSRVRYFITFASRHPDAMLLMNDTMCSAYYGQMHQKDYEGTLFAETDWRSPQSASELDAIILQKAKANPGLTRKDLWLTIVQEHFMRFTAKEYRNCIKGLMADRKLEPTRDPVTGRLNDTCKIYLPDGVQSKRDSARKSDSSSRRS